MEQKVWSVTIKGKNDCVVLTDFEAMQVKMKFMPDIEMYDMTERFGEICTLAQRISYARYNAP